MIEKLKKSNVDNGLFLVQKLWPGSSMEELNDGLMSAINSENEDCFLYKVNNSYIGFIQLSIRKDYVEGSSKSPVAHIEGIYVEEGYRRNGIANELVKFAEVWGKEKGCTEIASDCELDNKLSIDFHSNIGFNEVNRLVCFIKEIRNM